MVHKFVSTSLISFSLILRDCYFNHKWKIRQAQKQKGLPIHACVCIQPFTCDKARMIFQSSRALPGGATTNWVCWARPSVLTQVALFSVQAAPGSTTSAISAPTSPWCPWQTTKASLGKSLRLMAFSSAPSMKRTLGLWALMEETPALQPMSNAPTCEATLI